MDQKYYFDKISKTKRNQNVLESTQVSSSSNNNKRNKLGATSSNIDLFDNISIDGLENHHIDTLLPNALEISRSYRERLNSSSVYNSTVAAFNNTTLTNNNNNNKNKKSNDFEWF